VITVTMCNISITLTTWIY